MSERVERLERIVMGDKTIYIYVINLYPHEEPASKRNLKPYIISEADLL